MPPRGGVVYALLIFLRVVGEGGFDIPDAGREGWFDILEAGREVGLETVNRVQPTGAILLYNEPTLLRRLGQTELDW